MAATVRLLLLSALLVGGGAWPSSGQPGPLDAAAQAAISQGRAHAGSGGGVVTNKTQTQRNTQVLHPLDELVLDQNGDQLPDADLLRSLLALQRPHEDRPWGQAPSAPRAPPVTLA